MGEPNGTLPLAGVRVVDFTQHAAGPLASKFLSDHGAEVILIESASYIESAGGSRQVGPPGLSPVNTAYFHNKMNPGKLSVTINLATAEGVDLVKRLIGKSDVLIANMRPHVLEKWGLTYPIVQALRPDIVYVTMPTMGAGGPRSFYGGVSWGIQAMAGWNVLSGYADRPPTSLTPYSHPDVSCNPLHATVAVLAALRYRRSTGRGQLIELSQYESSICWAGPSILNYSVNGALTTTTENRHPAAAPHDVYRCAGEDTWCAIAVFSDAQWRALCQAIRRPELAQDPRYATLLARKAHEDELRGIVEPWTTQRTPEQAMGELQGVGVACGAVNDLRHLMRDDPQLKARGYWTEVEHPELGTVIVEDWGVQLSRVPRARDTRAPLLGEHNDYVFHELLELDDEQIVQYVIDGVLQ
jgi:benzylsuccinate CoA-transferase BbsF subunit